MNYQQQLALYLHNREAFMRLGFSLPNAELIARDVVRLAVKQNNENLKNKQSARTATGVLTMFMPFLFLAPTTQNTLTAPIVAPSVSYF